MNSLRDVVGHVENALYMMKGKRHEDEPHQPQQQYQQYQQHPQYHNSASLPPQHAPPPQNYGEPPYSPPNGWSQHWDQRSQRYYYIEQATGRSQWEPPTNQYRQSPRPTSSHHQQRYSGDQSRGNGSGEYNRPHSGQHLRAHSNSNAPQLSRNGSPLPRAMSIPPGYSLDTKTGQLVNTMLPPEGHHSAPVKYW